MENLCSEAINELSGAMLKVQAEISPAVKDRENPFAKARYATLNSVVEASREALLKHGIWLVQYSVPAEQGHLGLVTKLIHAASGQWQASLMVMPLPKADPQGYGSALTYARRYSLAALVGLVVEDDDGEAACGRSRKERKKATLDNRSVVPDSSSASDLEPGNTPPAESENEILKKLPHLEGINYQLVTTPDGRACVIATGHTAAKKEMLSAAGFRRNAERKIWWRYADAA
ncbi:single-stranded DNA-binding protein [Deltaproteobacteria bacterium Smac51]|nr:single-stranded DNA-binding protein [Deltaproteobacteria bacterium Smac51]